MQAIGCRTAPPRWYLWNLLQAFGHPGRRWASYAGEYEHRGAAMRRLTALIEAADEAERSAMRARIFEVLRWIIGVDAHTLRGVTRVSWRWFAKRAANWRNHQERLAAAEPSEWAVPFDSRRSQGHVVKVLRNGRELLEEGRAMSHCIDRYAEHCVRGVYLAVSIRRPDRTRPIATAAIAFSRGRWSLTEVAGACNSVPRPIAVRLAAETARAINMLGWRSPSSMNDQRKSEPSSDDPAEGADNPCEGGDGGQCEEHR